MTDSPINVFTEVVEVYPDLHKASLEAIRWNHLVTNFQQRFGHPPTHICRAPGRVNLIGEHIDYALFGVLPAAVDRDILIACAPREGSSEIRAQNLNEELYTSQNFIATRVDSVKHGSGDDRWTLDIDKGQLRWESYVKAGYYGVLHHFFCEEDSVPQGIDMLVTGTVPPGSGLSSSAAMVVASTLTFLTMNNKLSAVTKSKLVSMTMENEKRVGVNSGGMDQSASIFSIAHHALYISFYPNLSPTQIALPETNPPTCFVIANSLKVSEKVISANIHYNLRVVETLVGARVLAYKLGLGVEPKRRITLREVLALWAGEENQGGSEDPIALEQNLAKFDEEVERILGSENGTDGLTLETMILASGLETEEFKDIYLSWVDVEATQFQLYKRAKHVYSEARRVLEFRRICIESHNKAGVHIKLGELMDASQKSCNELFDCSCDELNELTSLAKRAGAWGSRLTGAGWGGSTVSLVTVSEVSGFIENLRQTYKPYQNLDDAALSQVIFATKPGSGAGVFRIDSGKHF